MRRTSWLPTALLAACLLVLLQPSCGQMPYPLTGKGVPPDGNTQVFVDVMLDSVEGIASERNAFGAVMWLHFSWKDPRALPAITEATTRWFQDNSTCHLPCDATGHAAGGCCDGVWLPHIDLSNLVHLEQEAVYKYRVWVQPGARATGGQPTDVVHWAVRVTGEYHSPFDFRAWPFEHQHLLLELQLPPAISDRVSLVLGSVKLAATTPHTKGEVIPGWYIAKVTRRVFDYSVCYNKTNAATSFFSFDGTQAQFTPVYPETWAQLRTASANTTITTLKVENCQTIPYAIPVPGVDGGVSPEILALYNPHILVVDMMIRRVKDYYLLSNIIPQLLLAYMVFVTYAMERSDLEARMGVIVTLVLAVTALQFSWNFPPANYLNAVQQITLTSYCLYFVVAVESMVASHICRMHEQRRKKQQIIAVLQAPAGSTLPASASMALQPGSVRGVGGAGSDFADYRPAPSMLSIAASLPEEDEALSEASAVDARPRIGFMPRQARGTMATYRAGNSSMPRTIASAASSDQESDDRPRGWEGNFTRQQRSGPVAEGVFDRAGEIEVGYISRRSTGRPRPVCEATEGVVYNSGSELPYPQAVRITLPNGLRSQPTGIANGVGGSSAAFYRNVGSDLEDAAPRHLLNGVASGKPAAGSSGAVPVDVKATLTKSDPLKRSKLLGSKRLHGAVVTQGKKFQTRLSRDEAFAQLFAQRLDVIFCWTLLVAYTVVTAVLLYINTEVGDHKLMLQGDRPANM